MRDTMTATTNQWMQFYQQPLMDVHALPLPTEGSSDATVMTTSLTSPTIIPSVMSPNSSYTSSGQLTPKGNVSKPIRRRSRASKRTPTTLLNANTTNFRALVQQFTGCPSTTMSSSSLGVHKGPITLNFQQGSRQQIHLNTNKIMSPFSSRSYNQVPVQLPWQKEPDQMPQQQLLQDQQSGYSFDYGKNSNFLPNSGNSRLGTSMDVSDDGLILDNDFSLHDLTVNAFSNDTF
ncbi:hypothetical protein SESBI_35285 [Sesbania bispinosa]|nr:hypothetical protein SESBI_35285 [Sesbania bispinosa]